MGSIIGASAEDRKEKESNNGPVYSLSGIVDSLANGARDRGKHPRDIPPQTCEGGVI